MSILLYIPVSYQLQLFHKLWFFYSRKSFVILCQTITDSVMYTVSPMGFDLSLQLDQTTLPPWAKSTTTLCTGDSGIPRRQYSDMRKSIRSAFRRYTSPLRTAFALDVLLARCPIEPFRRTLDVPPKLSSLCTQISSLSLSRRTGNTNTSLHSTTTSLHMPGQCPSAPKLQQ